ncbi:MAG: glycosyltransferase [Acidobacteria bacterium]|nr:glycosyltransferase [Acidobacteriota bacterium]MBI3421444.1 glycosyltransferase [Acidobacteriota bacterium]
MLVSVIIPCYNQAHFVGDAIASVLAQTWPHREIIVVDDGSRADPASVVARYPGVKLIQQSNRGVSAARNHGMRTSQGEFLMFLDADDRLTPNALEAHLQQLQTRPACVIATGHYREIAGDGKVLGIPQQRCVTSDHYATLLGGGACVWLPAAVLYRRAELEAVGGWNEARSGCADWELYLRLAQRYPICCHAEVVAEYRQHLPSMSRNSAAMLRDALAVFAAQADFVRAHPELTTAYRAGLHRARSYYGERLTTDIRLNLRAGQWRQVVGGVLTLARYYPQAIPTHAATKLKNLVRGVPPEEFNQKEEEHKSA